MDRPHLDVERHTRRTTGEMLRKERVISKMIDRIKTLFQDVEPIEIGAGTEQDDAENDAGMDDLYLEEESPE